MDTASGMDQHIGGRASVRVFNIWFAVVSLCVCLVAIVLAWLDKSWGALYIAIVACPMANLVLMILGTISAFIVKRFNPRTKLSSMLVLVLCLPPLGALATAAAVFRMPLHGC
jgi:ABC-type transport system involved in cytochrome c biogenesis permease component